jgi:hypothetical protein
MEIPDPDISFGLPVVIVLNVVIIVTFRIGLMLHTQAVRS